MTPTTLAAATHNVGSLERIPLGEGRSYRVGAEEIAVFRPREGGLFACQAACTHRGGPLADGLIGSGKVVCPLHGNAFELATGAPIRHSCAALRTYPVEATAAGELVITVPTREEA